MSTNMPDLGQQAIADSLTPVPDTSNLSLTNSAPSLQPSGQPTGPDSGVSPAEQAPQIPTGPAKPSLWKTVLSGALQGLAAGASVNTRGMSGSSAFAAGAGAGANQVLNVQPQQKAALDQSKAETAFHYAQLAHIQREINLMPDNKREQYLTDAADTYTSLLRSGAAVPMSQPGDVLAAQQQLQQLHAKNPWAVYSIMPVRGDDGTFQYSAVQFTKSPTQADITIKGAGPDGADLTIPAGTQSDKVGMVYSNIVSKKIESESKSDLQGQKDAAAMDRQKVKGAQAAAKPGKVDNMLVGSLPDGSQVAGNADQLKAWGATGITKLPSDESKKVIVARQMVAPNGLFHSVAGDLAALEAKGKLGVAASRWADFMAGKIGDEPDFAPLRTDMGLLATALMQAHVGARGSADMLHHFESLADYRISDAATLRAALSREFNYVSEKSMLPKQGGK
jgi:hypothetical protein